MELRIKDLLAKYWTGETSLSEESELKVHFEKNPALTKEGKYFRSVNNLGTSEKITFNHPGKTSIRTTWTVAATMAVGLITAVMVFQDAREQRQYVVDDPKEAYEITRKALLMVSSGLQEGKTYTKEITKINKAEEIIIEN